MICFKDRVLRAWNVNRIKNNSSFCQCYFMELKEFIFCQASNQRIDEGDFFKNRNITSLCINRYFEYFLYFSMN